MTDLKRSLRLADGLAMVVGMTVGAGIFRTPGIVAARLGRPGLTFVVWVLGAALAFLGALCFAELTTRQPRAAGKYAFVRERSEEHTSELQSRLHLVCRLLLEKKKKSEDLITVDG